MAQKYNLYVIVSAILIVVAVIYCYNPFLLYFQNDDFLHIQLSKQGVLFQRNSFRPVCDISIMLDALIWKKFAVGYHLTNLILHVIASLLVYRLAVKIGIKYFISSNKNFPLIAALLFFAYPSHSEAVFWVLGRSAVLGSIFSLLFLLSYLDAKNNRVFLLSALWFLLALLTYESAWILPVVVWIMFVISKEKRKSIAKPLLLSVLFGGYLLIRLFVIKEVVGNYEAYNFLHANVTVLVTNYAKLLYRSFMPGLQHNSFVIGSFIAVNLILIVSFFRLDNRRKKQASVFVLIFLVTLLPYTSLGIDTSGTEAERFLYFPSIILCVIVAFVLVHAFKNLKIAWLFSLAFCGVFISLLLVNAVNYRTAGQVVKKFITEVEKMKDKERLIIENLPQSQHGALILRQGVEPALQLFAPGKIKQVILCSKMPETSFFSTKKYEVVEKKISPDKDCYPDTFNTKTDACMLFTNQGLIVSK